MSDDLSILRIPSIRKDGYRWDFVNIKKKQPNYKTRTYNYSKNEKIWRSKYYSLKRKLKNPNLQWKERKRLEKELEQHKQLKYGSTNTRDSTK